MLGEAVGDLEVGVLEVDDNGLVDFGLGEVGVEFGDEGVGLCAFFPVFPGAHGVGLCDFVEDGG